MGIGDWGLGIGDWGFGGGYRGAVRRGPSGARDGRRRPGKSYRGGRELHL